MPACPMAGFPASGHTWLGHRRGVKEGAAGIGPILYLVIVCYSCLFLMCSLWVLRLSPEAPIMRIMGVA